MFPAATFSRHGPPVALHTPPPPSSRSADDPAAAALHPDLRPCCPICDAPLRFGRSTQKLLDLLAAACPGGDADTLRELIEDGKRARRLIDTTRDLAGRPHQGSVRLAPDGVWELSLTWNGHKIQRVFRTEKEALWRLCEYRRLRDYGEPPPAHLIDKQRGLKPKKPKPAQQTAEPVVEPVGDLDLATAPTTPSVPTPSVPAPSVPHDDAHELHRWADDGGAARPAAPDC
jgi:hypothetical protein